MALVPGFGVIDFEVEYVEIESSWPSMEPIEPEPELPAEVHNKRPIDADKCMAAVRAMSRG